LFPGGGAVRPTLAQFDIERVSERLTGQIVHMGPPQVISSTRLKIHWEVGISRESSHRFGIQI